MIQLTFKQKLIAVVFLTLSGITYLGFVAFSSLNQLTQTSQRVSYLTATSDLLSQLQLSLLSTENSLALLDPAQAEVFQTTLQKSSRRYSDTLQKTLEQAHDRTLLNKLTLIEQQFTQYAETLINQVSAQKTVGFNNSSGLLHPLAESAAALEEQLSSFSMLLQHFIIARQLEKEYLITPSHEGAQKLQQQLKVLVFEVKDAEFYDAFGPYIERYLLANEQLIVAINKLSDNSQKLISLKQAFQDEATQTQTYLRSQLLSKARVQAEDATQSAQWTIITVSFFVATVISALLASTAFSTMRVLKRIIKQLSRIVAGNLTQSLPVRNKKQDEFDQVSDAVNSMTGDLRQVISQVADNQSSLFQQSSELSQAIQTIAENNNHTSDQSNVLASATEEISTTAEQVAERVLSLQQDSLKAHQSAIDGGGIISQAMHSLGETAQIVEESSQQLMQLEQHSTEIDKVLVIINDLADQTNLLALNAAIEAARAGEAGRGFSVVADEVRTLAESTVKATGDITDTVRSIQQQTRSVIQVMNKSQRSIIAVKQQGDNAQQAVEKIELQTAQTSSTSSEITLAIEEVARTTREMANSMDKIALRMASNRAASTAIVTSAEHLKINAEKMGQMTSKFSYG